MEAASLRSFDKDYRNHLQAFLNLSVRAEKKAGKNKTKPVYDKFKKFFDYDKEIARVRKKKVPGKFSGLIDHMKRKEG